MSAAQNLYAIVPPWVQTLLLNAYAWRIERHRYGAPYRAEARAAELRERWPFEQLRQYQAERLRVVVDHAYRHSSYYRALFDAQRLRPADIRGPQDLHKIPLLPKDVVRSRGTELMTRAQPGRGWWHGHTSGTTGSPLSIWYDRHTCIVNNAVDRRQKAWGGMPLDGWVGLILGRVVVPLHQRRPPYWRANRVQRQLWFSAFHMDEHTLATYVAEMRRRGLAFLEGYPSTIYILARYLRRQGITLPMRAVFTSSETLLAMQRETIEAAFACPVFDFYGLAERVLYAGECEQHAGKHVAEDFGCVEVVDGDGAPVPAGKTGYLVGTSLHNTAMPMLRYRTSDVSALVTKPCPCGRTFVRIRDITTKAEDIVVTPDGRLISPSILTHPFKPLDQILKSQIIQERPDHLLVQIVPSAEFAETHKRQLIAGLQERLGSEVQVEIRIVDDIPREASGKFRWVISRVPHDYAVSWDRA